MGIDSAIALTKGFNLRSFIRLPLGAATPTLEQSSIKPQVISRSASKRGRIMKEIAKSSKSIALRFKSVTS
jgi:hypothetical protein